MKKYIKYLTVMFISMASLIGQDKSFEINNLKGIEAKQVVSVTGILNNNPFIFKDKENMMAEAIQSEGIDYIVEGVDYVILATPDDEIQCLIFLKSGEKKKFKDAFCKPGFFQTVKGYMVGEVGENLYVMVACELVKDDMDIIDNHMSPTNTALHTPDQISKDIKPGQQGSFVAKVGGPIHSTRAQLDKLNDWLKMNGHFNKSYSYSDNVMSVAPGKSRTIAGGRTGDYLRYKEPRVSVQCLFDIEWLQKQNLDMRYQINSRPDIPRTAGHRLFRSDQSIIVEGTYAFHIDVRGHRVYIFKNCKFKYAHKTQVIREELRMSEGHYQDEKDQNTDKPTPPVRDRGAPPAPQKKIINEKKVLPKTGEMSTINSTSIMQRKVGLYNHPLRVQSGTKKVKKKRMPNAIDNLAIVLGQKPVTEVEVDEPVYRKAYSSFGGASVSRVVNQGGIANSLLNKHLDKRIIKLIFMNEEGDIEYVYLVYDKKFSSMFFNADEYNKLWSPTTGAGNTEVKLKELYGTLLFNVTEISQEKFSDGGKVINIMVIDDMQIKR